MENVITKILSLSEKEFGEYLLSESLSVLHSVKLYADDIYYNSGKSSGLNDWRYDALKDTLNIRDPHYIIPTGALIRDHENRTKLPFWLGSMNKFKPEDDKAIIKWIASNKSPEYIIEDKLDGISCLLVVKNSKINIYTRGDGIIGADISYLVKYLKNIPSNIKQDISVRGELIMNNQVFKKKYEKEYANPRNMVAGLIGSKKMKEGVQYIEFVAYEVINSGVANKPSQQLKYLDDLGFTTVWREMVKDFNVDNLMEYIIRSKETSKYEIDGIIVQPNSGYERNTSGNPQYAFAFKMRLSDNLIRAKVLQVEWNVSKWGVLKPRVEIEPVQLGGVTITWASGFNAKFIVEKSIGVDSVIEITRSGDVIPYIVSVVKKAKDPDMPTIPYTWNETGVDIKTTEYEDEMAVKRIASFFSELGIKHVGEKNVQKIYESGHDTLLKIIMASKEDFEKVPGFGKKLADRSWDNIHNGLKDLSLPLALGASGVFGIGLGTKKITTLLNDFPDLLEVSGSMKTEDILERIIKVEGFSHITAKKVVDNLEEAKQFIVDMRQFATFKDVSSPQSSEGCLRDMKIVLSGFRDKKLEEDIVARGGKVTTTVSKQTSILVVASIDAEPSGKAAKAKDLGVQIVQVKDFVNRFIH
jgi:NAD-dependent DNA ligase